MRLLTLGIAAFALAPSVASAWTYIDLNRSHWRDPLEVRLGAPSGDLEALAPGTTETELLRAMDDWLLVTCAEVPMSFGGTTDSLAMLGDGENVVAFVEEGWPHDPSFVGMTSYESAPCAAGVRCMTEADVELNGQNFTWEVVRGSLPRVNARSIILHELGHVLGLGHSSVQNAAMNASYFRGYLLLNADDQSGICTIYPREPERVCEGGDCPYGSVCVEGACQRASLEPCTTAMDCAFDETCNEENGRCIQVPPGSDEIGVPCETDDDCSSRTFCDEVKGGRICTAYCDGLSPRSCPSGFHCDRGATTDCLTGLCAVGGSAGGALGTPCDDATDCGSLFCADGVCALPCDLAAPVCPSSMVCHADMDDGCGACAAPRALGESCIDNDQCDSGICLVRRDTGTCTTPCETDDQCPEGLACQEEGGVRFCLPRAQRDGCSCGAAAPGGAAGWILVALALGFARRRTR